MSNMINAQDNTLVGLHFRGYPEVDANIYDNALLVKALGGIGVSTVLIPGMNAYDFSKQTVKAYPLQMAKGRPSIEVSADLQDYPLGSEGVGAVRARVGIGEEVEELAAIVNDTKTRELGIDKWAQYQLAGDFMPTTRRLEPTDNLSSELLESMPGDKIVIKKSGGGEGNWVAISDKSLPEAERAVREMRQRIAEKLKENPNFRQDLIIQEFVPGERIDGLSPIENDLDATESNLYNVTGKNGHELRFYCFLQGSKTKSHDYFANLRAFDHDNEGQWIFINQNSLPEGAILLAQQISDRFLEQTKSKGALVAIDLFHGQRSIDAEPRWLVREINAKDPIMARSTRSFNAAYRQRTKLGQLLADLARDQSREGL